MRRVLLNPGPVTISEIVRKALMKPDNCHREKEIINVIQDIRKSLVWFSGGGDEYTSTLLVSSGTGALESALISAIRSQKEDWKEGERPNDCVLVLSNGAYGKRIEDIYAKYKSIKVISINEEWGKPISLKKVEEAFESRMFGYVVMVHHETTTGLLNPIKEVGDLAKKYNCTFIVDAISSFGGIPLNVKECNIDYLVGVPNKCIQGLPGVSFVIAKKSCMEAPKDIDKSFYLDLDAEWKHQEETGMFRFTSPIQILYVFQRALQELKRETIKHRYERYSKNYDTLVQGMPFDLFKTNTPSKLLATFYFPRTFNFNKFHDALYKRGFVIYPGKLQKEKTFRVAVMGDITKINILIFLKTVKSVI